VRDGLKPVQRRIPYTMPHDLHVNFNAKASAPGAALEEELAMEPVELIGHVDEQHQLHVELPHDVPPGPVKITLQSVSAADEDADWLALIHHSWAKDWSDPQEDIYTLEDGKPSH